MTVEELLLLNPKHIDELRSFYATCPFEDVEVVAHEKAFVEQNLGTFATNEFATAFGKINALLPVGGVGRTHQVYGDDSGVMYLFSGVSDGEVEDRVIFKIITE